MAVLARIRMLGALQLQQGDRLITRFRYQKAAALLAYLAYYRQHTHTREQLIERFWPDLMPEAARSNLSNSLSSLRHQLEPPGTPSGAVLLADRFHVGLRPEAASTDVGDFKERLKAADGSESSMQQIQCLSDALNLYAGPLLPGFYEEWIVAEGRRLSDAFVQAARRLVRLLARAGEGERALEVACRAVTVDPLREEAHRDLMQLYVAMGQPSAALGQYRELERLLEQELGEAPSAATRRLVSGLHERLTTETPSTDGSAATVPEAREWQPASTNEENTTASIRRPVLPIKPPPSGTITFLMLDWGRSDGRASASEGKHGTGTPQAALLKRMASGNGGYLFQAGGDSFGLAFSSTMDALSGALAILREMENGGLEGAFAAVSESGTQTFTHPPAVPASLPRPRLALHSGDVALQGAAYSGPVLQRAQRLVLSGHGGQLLCSETTAALLRRELEQGIQLLDLGLYRLGSVLEAERVWQVVGNGAGSAAFPPLKVARGTPSHLPLQLTRFFGREAEIARLLSLLGRPASSQGGDAPSTLRLVTLTGPGGMGKTRLALELGTGLEEAWEGAIWFVPLADLTDAAMIPSALVSTLGLSRSATIEPLEHVIAALNARPTLLILDNFEHLVEAGTEIVTTLLQRVPTLTCLVTSRQRLEIAGEHEVEVVSLAVPTLGKDLGQGRKAGSTRKPDHPAHTSSPALPSTRSPSPDLVPDLATALLAYESVRLFVDRAQTVKPDFQLTANNAGAVATLCAGLEGIPLALELAASRAQVLTPAQMLEQMGDRFRFLVSRRRDTAARHRTLFAAVEWSYRLLSPQLQQVFARLSVFRGGWDLDAAEALCDDLDLAPLDALAQLRECSLVLTEEQGSAMRFRMLETLREYAQRRLQENGEETAVSRRHTEFYLAWAEQAAACLLSPEQRSWLDRLDVEHDNLRAALAWCAADATGAEAGLRLLGALWLFWERRGHLSEGRSLIERTLSRAGEISRTVAHAQALLGAGRLAYLQGEIAQSRTHYEESLVLYRQWEDNRGIADALNGLGGVAETQGDSVLARTCLEESLRLRRLSGDKPAIASTLYNLGRLARWEGDNATARILYEQALVLDRATGDRRNIALSILNLATIALEEDDGVAARSLLEECGCLFQQLGDVQGRALWSNRQGELACLEGDYTAARTWHMESLRIRWELKDKRGLAESLEQLAGIAILQADFPRAVQLFAVAAALHEQVYGSARLPQQGKARADAIAHIVSQLGEAAFATAWSAGQAMTLEQAVEYALRDQ